MPGDFQVICGSMVGENRRSPASTETPVLGVLLIVNPVFEVVFTEDVVAVVYVFAVVVMPHKAMLGIIFPRKMTLSNGSK